MAKRTSLPPEPGPPTDGWVVSFSDCMTNLLCFFVLLVSFSSFDTAAQGRIQGAFTSMSNPGLTESLMDPTDAIIPPQQRPFDPTPQGAEKPTDRAPEPIIKPQSELVPDIDAIHDQVTIRVPAKRLFWGAGDVLTSEGKADLKLVGSYMRLLPVRAVVKCAGSESDLGLRRAWAVSACISSEGLVSADRMCITSGSGAHAAEPTIEILLLRKEVIR